MINSIYQLNIQNISFDVSKECKLFKNTYNQLINIAKEEFTLIEKIAYELASFHARQLNLNEKEIYIEFFMENVINSKMTIDSYKDASMNICFPIISTITYLDDSMSPDIFTNVDIDAYKFKNFTDKSIIGISIPKKFKHISFEGGKYFHGAYNIFNETNEKNVLKVNIWEKNRALENIELYKNEINYENITFKKEDTVITSIEKNQNNYIITVNENENLFEDLLYKNCANFDKGILEILLNFSNDYNFFILEKIIEPIKNIKKSQTLIVNSSIKFNQRFIIKNLLNSFVCNYILNEANEVFNDNKIKYNDYEALDIEKAPRVMNLILHAFQVIIENIKKSYCLNKNETYHIDNIMIIKNNTLNINNFFNDVSTISIYIVLNVKFQGGNLKFDDELEYILEVGDMIICAGKDKRTILPIFNGEQYILAGFINIYE